MVNIKDVAKKAGVSIAAVSYALNDKAGVNEEKKKIIKQIAEEMGYIPNSLAKGLLLKKTDVIGIVVPDISAAYTASFLKHLDRYARDRKFFLLLGSTSNDVITELEIINRFISKNVDALVITPGNYYDETVYEGIVADIHKRHIPFLFTSMSFPNIKSSYVVPDLEDGEYRMTRYLLENGLKDFVFLGGRKHHHYTGVKYKGFQKACREFLTEFDESRFIECGENYSFEEGYAATAAFLKHAKLPEAFVCVNDLMAYGAVKGLKEHGLSVPEDVSVVGYDDLEFPTIDAVGLTTVRIPLEEMAKRSIEILGGDTEPDRLKQLVLRPELVIRDSVRLRI